MKGVTGLHHVTAIAGPPQENLDFYAGVLGMRLVKRSVNQDDPGTYHLFYADAVGHPGTDLTFFPWQRMAPPRPGHGLSTDLALAVPPGTLGHWSRRLARYGVAVGAVETRFGEPTLPLADPHGLRLALVESLDALDRPFEAWRDSPVAGEHQIRGLHAARVVVRDLEPTAGFVTEVLGFRPVGTDAGWVRFAASWGGSGTYLDVQTTPALAARGAWGVGSVHHLAWRVDDEAHLSGVRARVAAAGRRPTDVIDRFWFKSVYFPEPGGVLFELATDGPGFGVDEDPARLGQTLVLPPWLEPRREVIESRLPVLSGPVAAERP